MGRGDHVYIWHGPDTEEGIGGFYHHGIDDGYGSVYHYSSYHGEKTLKNGVIRKTSWGEFVANSKSNIHIVEYANPDFPDVIIARAESKLGQEGYNLVFNNCEHFSRWCVTGFPVSHQVMGAFAGGTLASIRLALGKGSIFTNVMFAFHTARLWELIFNNRMFKWRFTTARTIRVTKGHLQNGSVLVSDAHVAKGEDEDEQEQQHSQDVKYQSSSRFDAWHNVNWVLRRAWALQVVAVIATELVLLRNPLFRIVTSKQKLKSLQSTSLSDTKSHLSIIALVDTDACQY